MFSIPLIHKGEIIQSWLENVAFCNGFPSYSFMRASVENNSKLFSTTPKETSILMPDFNQFGSTFDIILAEASKYNITRESLITDNTLFPFVKAITCQNDSLPLNDQYNMYRQITGFENIYDVTALIKNHNPSEIRYCLKCIAEDLQNEGCIHASLSHNFPYVCYCNKHNASLVTFPNGKPSLTNPFITCNLNPPPKNHLYCSAIGSLLSYCVSHPSFKLYELNLSLIRLADLLNIDAYDLDYAVVSEGYISRNYLFKCYSRSKCSPLIYFNSWHNGLAPTQSIPFYAIYNYICIILFFFGSYDNFEHYCHQRIVSDKDLAQIAVNHKGFEFSILEVVNTARPSLTIRHNICGHVFHVYATLFFTECACPVCYKSPSFSDLKSAIAEASSGSVSLISQKNEQCVVEVLSVPDHPCFQTLHNKVMNQQARFILSEKALLTMLNDHHASTVIPFHTNWNPVEERTRQKSSLKRNVRQYLSSLKTCDSIKINTLLVSLAYTNYTLLTKNDCELIATDALNDLKFFADFVPGVGNVWYLYTYSPDEHKANLRLLSGINELWAIVYDMRVRSKLRVSVISKKLGINPRITSLYINKALSIINSKGAASA